MGDRAVADGTAGGGLGRRAGGALLLFAAYLLLAVVATFPLARDASDHVYGLGTPPLNVWAMAWVDHQLPRDPLHLFDGNAFYPYSDTLAFSEHLFIPALLGAPVALATSNYVLMHNVVALLTFALAGCGMFLLAYRISGHRGAAFAAGVLYAFHSWNVNELIRIQILSNEWFPFLLWGLLRYFDRPTWRRGTVVGLLYLLQALSCMYWALYLPLLVGPALVALEWRRRLALRRLAPLAVGLAVACLLTIPFLTPYLETARQWAFARPAPESMGMVRYLSVSPRSLLYPWLPKGNPNVDAPHFVGLVALALALVGLVAGRVARGLALGRGFLALVVAAGFLLSLGPRIQTGYGTLGPGPYQLLYHLVPGFQNVRYPERFAVFVMLGLAPLVALGLARLGGRRLWPAGVAAGVIFLEHLSIPLPLEPLPVGKEVPEVYRWLARQDDVAVVAEVPGGRYLNERADALPMFLSTVHWKRTVQGFTGYFPPPHNFVRWRLHHFPSPESVAFLEGFGVDTLIVHDPSGRVCRRGRWPRAVVPFSDGSCVVRLRPTGRLLAPPGPDARAGQLVEVDRHGWRVSAVSRRAARAIDGDPDTVWTTGQPQEKGQVYRIRFGRSVAVARVVVDVPPPFEFPLSLRLVGERPDGERAELPFDERAALDRLLGLLLHRPREAAVVIDLPTTVLRELTLRVHDDDSFRMPWTMSEVRVYTERGPTATDGVAQAAVLR